VLLPLPEIPSALSTGEGDRGPNIFENFRRFGLAYLDENGEQLKFSAGTVSGDEGYLEQTEETEATASECSDSEGDVTDVQESGMKSYWPYPSKTVSDNSH